MIDGLDVSFGRVWPSESSSVSFDDPLLRNAEVSELQVKYDRVVAMLNSVSWNYDTRRSLVREHGTKIVHLQALLAPYSDEFKLLKGEI